MDDPLIVAVRWGLYLTLSAAFGVPLFALHALRNADQSVLPTRGVVGASAVAGLLLSLLGWAALTASMADKPMLQLDSDDLSAMLVMPGVGAAWIARMAALGMLAITTIFARQAYAAAVVASALGAVALASLAWTGHGAATEGAVGSFHLAADIVHLLAAGAWVGTLFSLIVLLWRADLSDLSVVHRALASFSVTGTVLVGAIVATGLVNLWVLAGPGRLLMLASSPWGRLLLIKLMLFGAMLALAALNRFRLTPALEGGLAKPAIDPFKRLRRSVMVEAGAAVAVLAAVAWLGTLMPPDVS